MLVLPVQSQNGDKNYITTIKTVKTKSTAVATDYEYQYNFLAGKFVLVPRVYTKYYFTYTDNTSQSVNMNLYNTVEVGGKVRVKELKHNHK